MEEDTEFQLNAVKYHGKELTGNYKHYCPEWDGLPIDDTCPEFEACLCDKETMRDLSVPVTVIMAK